VDAVIDTDIVPDSMPRREDQHKAEATEPPSTPPCLPSDPVEPTSRVTINLRTRPLDSIPSSPPSPATPSKMPNAGVDAGTILSVESESDALSAIPAIETPSSSSSPIGSPQIELVTIEDDDDLSGGDPGVAIISDDTVYLDPLMNFPYFSDGETLCQTVGRLGRFLQHGSFLSSFPGLELNFTEDVSNDESFCKIRDWIDNVLNTHTQLDTFYELYKRNREFWAELPNLIWALSYRRLVVIAGD
jgi:ubiquitin carboxyl-terminal hydrolase 34